MHITFCGAAHEVTGSCHLIETTKKKILLDCGMFQGSDFNEGKNHDKFPFDPTTVSVVLVSHAHLDHVGRIPKLVKEGFEGRIILTKGTKELAKLIWEDAYSIMVYNNRKFQSPILYEQPDIDAAYALCEGVDYNTEIDLGDGELAVLHDAGHIFGSSFIDVIADGKRITFSGDFGNHHAPIINDTERLGTPDILLLESTYGDRIHETVAKRKETINHLITEGVKRGGTIMIPAFSLERTQELLYELHDLSLHDQTLPKVPIFLDSPLAIDAMKVYKKYTEYYDEGAKEEWKDGEDFLDFPGLHIAYTRDESKAINQVPGPKIVIAGSGMMNGGRIVHHAARYLSDPNSTLIIVGYQAQGTLGRRLYEGAERVRIFNEDVDVRCTITAIGELSAHGDQIKLLDWIRTAEHKPQKIYCVHGEPHAATELAHHIRNEFGIPAFVPEYGERVEV